MARKLQYLGIFLAEMMTNVSIILPCVKNYRSACASFDDDALVFLSDYYDYTHPEQYILLHFLVILIITVLCFGLNDHIFLRFKKQDVYFFFFYILVEITIECKLTFGLYVVSFGRNTSGPK